MSVLTIEELKAKFESGDMPNGTDFGGMFVNCFSLQSLPLLNTAKGTDFGYMFNGCYSLSTAALSGTKESINYFGCKLSANALNDIFDKLDYVSGKTISIYDNLGVSTCDISIAQNKGWAVIY